MGDMVQAQDAVFTLLEGRQRAADRVELYMLAGIVSGLLAKASHDLGKAHDAMTQARTMYVCVRQRRPHGLAGGGRAACRASSPTGPAAPRRPSATPRPAR